MKSRRICGRARALKICSDTGDSPQQQRGRLVPAFAWPWAGGRSVHRLDHIAVGAAGHQAILHLAGRREIVGQPQAETDHDRCEHESRDRSTPPVACILLAHELLCLHRPYAGRLSMGLIRVARPGCRRPDPGAARYPEQLTAAPFRAQQTGGRSPRTGEDCRHHECADRETNERHAECDTPSPPKCRGHAGKLHWKPNPSGASCP